MCIGCHGLSQDTKQGEGSLLWQLLAPRNWQDSKSTCEMWENPIPRLECGRWYVHETPLTCNMYLLKYLFMQISTQQKSLNTPHQHTVRIPAHFFDVTNHSLTASLLTTRKQRWRIVLYHQRSRIQSCTSARKRGNGVSFWTFFGGCSFFFTHDFHKHLVEISLV